MLSPEKQRRAVMILAVIVGTMMVLTLVAPAFID
jgi:hypothetical protein